MNNKAITIRADTGLLQTLKKVSKSNNRNTSILVRDFIKKYNDDGGRAWSVNVIAKHPDKLDIRLCKKLTVSVDTVSLSKLSEKAKINEQEVSLIIRAACREYIDENS